MQIDKQRTYTVDSYEFRNFIALPELDIEKVWRWRNAEVIRKLMYNKEFIPIEEHFRFVESLRKRDDTAYWLVTKKGAPLGVTYLADIDFLEKKAELGYYMIPEKMNSGIGLEFVYHVFLFHFEKLEINTLYSAMDVTNKNAIAVDTFMGCKLGEVISKGSDPNARFVKWILESNSFMKEIDNKCNIRSFVNYIRKGINI